MTLERFVHEQEETKTNKQEGDETQKRQSLATPHLVPARRSVGRSCSHPKGGVMAAEGLPLSIAGRPTLRRRRDNVWLHAPAGVIPGRRAWARRLGRARCLLGLGLGSGVGVGSGLGLGSKAAESAALEAASSSSRGSGWAPTGPASSSVSRAGALQRGALWPCCGARARHEV